MRPYKSEYWWYEIKPNSRYGNFEIADLRGLSDKTREKQVLCIENDPVFVRWLDLAYPSKHV